MLDKIDAWQVFWSILMMMMSYISIMITIFIKKLKELEAKIDTKVVINYCEKMREGCQRDCQKSREQRDKYIEKIYQDAEESCDDVKRELERKAHTHATIGQAGEVVK